MFVWVASKPFLTALLPLPLDARAHYAGYSFDVFCVNWAPRSRLCVNGQGYRKVNKASLLPETIYNIPDSHSASWRSLLSFMANHTSDIKGHDLCTV